ncbi:MAG TPA: von Willebrand factor type A domain-containing protein [Chitinophagaceae bacterium]|nr:von Willebrand factor type A domain-containing protein [Chitinophagaceae bacterium]
MKTGVQILFLLLLVSSLSSQPFYLRGEVRDEKGNLLQNVNIRSLSTGYMYRSGDYGSFGIPITKETDSLLFTFRGYQSSVVAVSSGKFISVVLKLLPSVITNVKTDKLASLTRDLSVDVQRNWYVGDETYSSLIENSFIETKKYPLTSISLNIDRASYSNTRRFINLGLSVPPDAVRIEEMLNNFNFEYQPPPENEIFGIYSRLTSCPWKKENQLYFVNIVSKKLNLDSLPPSNLVFLIDISGSMDMPNRLPLLKSAFHLLTLNLREKDTISIVIYGGAVGVMLFPASGKEKEKINKAIDEITPGGSTPGEAGIKLAYRLAKDHFIKGGNNRIILATDGDFNVGLKTEQELDELISRHRELGIYLTCLGVGMGNYKDSKIQTLAKKGNGNFAYLDTYQEAEKVLMKEFTQTIYTVADDVFMNVKFDPAFVKQYRLIGFDNKVGALSDLNSVIEGGEIGSGHSMMAAFEIIPNQQTASAVSKNQFAEIALYYKLPSDTAQQVTHKIFSYEPVTYKVLEPKYKFAASVIMFGEVLKNSSYTRNITWGEVLYHASETANPSDINQSQFAELVYNAKNLYLKSKKKKRRNY